MLRRRYEHQFCSLAWALEVLEERWTLLIVRDALLGVTRFGEFRRRLGITASVLATRLNHLVTAGIIAQIPYQTGPVRYDYRLTPSGQDLAVVVVALMRWADNHLAGEHGPPKVILHAGCDGRVEPRLVCGDCAQEVPPDKVTVATRRGRGTSLHAT